MRRLLAAAAAVLCLLAAGCGESGEQAAAPPPTPAAPTTTGEEPEPTTTAAADPDPVPGAPPLDTLEAYFERLNADAPEAAWALLAPAVRERFGGYDVWSEGIARRTSIVPAVTPSGGSRRAPEFEVEQAVVDETPCGLPAERTFAGTWTLEPDGNDGWLIADAEQTLVAGPPDLEALCASSGY